MKSNPIAELVSQLKNAHTKDPALARRLNELVSLNEIVAALATTDTSAELLNVLLLTVLGEYPCLKGAVLVKGSRSWSIGASRGLKKEAPDLSQFTDDEDWDSLPDMLTAEDDKPAALESLFQPNFFRYVFPMYDRDKLVGLIALGKSPLGDIEAQKVSLIRNMAGLGGMVIANQLNKEDMERMNRQLQRKVFQLKSLYEIAGSFARCYENDAVYQVLSKNLMGQFFISRCAVLNTSFQMVFNKGLKIEGKLPAFPPDECEKLLAQAKSAILDVQDAADSPTLHAFLKANKIFFICAISVENRDYGLLLLGNRMNRKPLSPDDRDFMQSLAQQAAGALENVALQLEVLEKKRMEKELELAREIQQSLLPKTLPSIEGYEIAVEMRPFQQVGGDFYDLIPLENGCLGICVADVSGKSLPASMIMSTTQASLRALTSFNSIGPVEVISKLNSHICASTQSNKYVTMFYAILDPKEHKLTYINAGHNRPILIANEHTRHLDKGGMVVGLFPNVQYQMETIFLEEGAELLIYTDGLSEVMNGDGEEFGDDRLEEELRALIGKGSAEDVKCNLIDRVMAFGDNTMIDDLTLIFIRRTCNK